MWRKKPGYMLQCARYARFRSALQLTTHFFQDDDLEAEPRYSSVKPKTARPSSIFSSTTKQSSIWLEEHYGASLAFARDVQISGWTNVGDQLSGAYVVYDCVITTKEGTIIHAHKRYSSFVELDEALRATLPVCIDVVPRQLLF